MDRLSTISEPVSRLIQCAENKMEIAIYAIKKASEDIVIDVELQNAVIKFVENQVDSSRVEFINKIAIDRDRYDEMYFDKYEAGADESEYIEYFAFARYYSALVLILQDLNNNLSEAIYEMSVAVPDQSRFIKNLADVLLKG